MTEIGKGDRVERSRSTELVQIGPPRSQSSRWMERDRGTCLPGVSWTRSCAYGAPLLATNVLSKTISLGSISNWGSRSDANHAHAPKWSASIVHLEVVVIHRHGRVLELSFSNDL